jgi:hypothetical protein
MSGHKENVFSLLYVLYEAVSISDRLYVTKCDIIVIYEPILFFRSYFPSQ